MSHLKVLFIVATLLLVTSAQKACRRYICSFTTEFDKTKPYVFAVHHIDPTLCTHVLLQRAPIEGNELKIQYWHDDLGPGGIYDELNKLKKKNVRLKIMLTVGDSMNDNSQLSKMAATEAGRKYFINFLIPFLRDRGFDGVDLDLTFPLSSIAEKSYKEGNADLIKEMAEAFGREDLSGDRNKLLLSASVATMSYRLIDAGYAIPVFVRHVDFINTVAFKYSVKGRVRLDHLSPLQSMNGINILDTVNYLVMKGMPKLKINVVLPAFGRRVYTKSSSDMIVGESYSVGLAPAGKYTNVTGTLAYYEICSLLKQGGKVHWDTMAASPYHIQDNYFLTYENEESYSTKVHFLRKYGYGGVVIQDLAMDDFLGLNCGNETFPLMRTLEEECTERYD